MRIETLNSIGKYYLFNDEKQLSSRITLYDFTVPAALFSNSILLIRNLNDPELQEDNLGEIIDAIDYDIDKHLYDSDKKDKIAFRDFLKEHYEDIEEGVIQHKIVLLEEKKVEIDRKINALKKRL